MKPFVLLVGDPASDAHVSAIADALTAVGAEHATVSTTDLTSKAFTVSDDVEFDGAPLGSDLTVFWRDPGVLPTPPEMRASEVQLVTAEAHALFLGALVAQQPRWVDDPAHIGRAANKVVQLRLARTLGIAAPNWLATNDPARAAVFIKKQRTLAKPISSGPGLNPDPAEITVTDIDRLRVAPTMLQQIVEADYDVRIVTVGNHVRAWQRLRRAGDPIAWRVIDPAGTDFFPVKTPPWHDKAVELAAALRVTTSVQDWLVRDGHPVFLELNTRGAWLFMEDAERELPKLFAYHLLRHA